MKVGIYFDLRNPAAWRQNGAELYRSTLELCAEADDLGIDSVWFSEHHLFDDGYLPQPLTMAAAAAARTKRIRVGTAVVIAPLYPAVLLAEQAAVVDLISGGRLDLGVGAGYRAVEFEEYGASLRNRYRTTIERVTQIREIWSVGRVTPRPVQERVPIWMGFQGPIGARRAGFAGEGLLSAFHGNAGAYLDGLAAAGHPVGVAAMSGFISAWVTSEPDRDWPMLAEHLRYQVDSYREHAVRGTGQPAPAPIRAERLIGREPSGAGGYFFFGVAEEVARSIRAYVANAPVETVFLWASIGGMPPQVTRQHVHRIATQLAPLLRQPLS